MAGDLTVYGQRNNVMLIRETEKGREIVKINLLNRDVLNSPYYYIRNGDIIYVEPSKAKVTFTDRTVQLIPIVTSITTAFVVALNLLLR